MFITYCAKQGVRLFSVNGSPSYLLSQAHAYLAKSMPVIFTEPDPYSTTPGMSHVCVFCEDGPGTITFMDPFGGHFITRSDSAQLNNLLFNQIWIMQKVETTALNIPQNWKDDGTTLIAPNGVKVVLGFRQYVLGHNWDPQNYPLDVEYHTDQLEVSNQSLGPGDQQIFRLSMLGYTTLRGVFEEWLGQELAQTRSLAAKLHSQVVDQSAKLAAQVTQLADLQKQLAVALANSAEAKYEALVKSLEDLVNPPKAA